MNIVHRDIKGENILLDKSMTKDNTEPLVKIADFGLSCYLDPESKGLDAFCGTDPYLAPEILKMW
jgi:serine/threonine protein kinase